MRKLLFIPVWLLTLLLSRFLKNHEWKDDPPTLEMWEENGTDFALAFSVLLWVNVIIEIVVLIKIL